MVYRINSKANTAFITASGETETIDVAIFERALADVEVVIESLRDIPVDIFSILGMRNLSAFIGELFAKSLIKESDARYVGNPHQDGYPDLLLMDVHGLDLYEKIKLSNGLRDKSPFSPFANGGLEIKATCGDVPTPAVCAKLKVAKPHIGDARIDLLKGYTWKAHHRETNNLVGILWDFLSGTPKIVAVFFGSDLESEDWGKIVQPKEGGGRTTSVSIMKKEGIGKLYKNWIAVEDDPRYINYINRYNRGHLI